MAAESASARRHCMTSRDGQAAGQSVLDEIKDGYAISDGTEHRVAVGREDEVALLVHGPAQVRELVPEPHLSSQRGARAPRDRVLNGVRVLGTEPPVKFGRVRL